MNTLNKDVRVVLSTGYGNINEWGCTFLEKERTRHNTYIGKVEDTIRVTITRTRARDISPVFGSWLDWEAGSKSWLAMKWITDRAIRLDPATLKWYKNGEETTPRKESTKGAVHADVVADLRCQAAGTPGLPLLVMRHHLISEVYTSSKMCNEPCLWVPRIDVDSPVNLIEKVLTYVCSGAGAVNTNLYWLIRGLCLDAVQATPWNLWQLSGGRAEIMMADLGKFPGMMSKLAKVVRSLIDDPHQMLGIKTTLKSFKKTIPWFLIDDASEQIPEIGSCWVTARRVDSTDRNAGAFIPSEQLGIPSWREIVSFITPEITPKQIAPVSSFVVEQELVL